MQSLIVAAHPSPNSFSAAMTQALAAEFAALGHGVDVLDLYTEDFDPVIRQNQFPLRADQDAFAVMTEQAHQAKTGSAGADVRRSQALLTRADNVVLQFPLWWWSLPAQMKGWVDRVLSAGFAYGGADLSGRRAMLAVVAETKSEKFRAEGAEHPLHHIERGILKFCGFDVLPAFVAADIYALGEEERRERLRDLRAHVRRAFG